MSRFHRTVGVIMVIAGGAMFPLAIFGFALDRHEYGRAAFDLAIAAFVLCVGISKIRTGE